MATDFDVIANAIYATVLTAPSPATSGTTVILQGGWPQFPDPGASGGYNVTAYPPRTGALPANMEIWRVTGVAGPALTIERAQEGTTAKTIVGDSDTDPITTSAWQVAFAPTAKAMTDMQDAINDIPAGGDVVGPASATDGRPALFDGVTGKLLKQASAALGSAAFANTSAFDASGAAAAAQAAAASDATTKANAAQAASQPVNANLTAISGLAMAASKLLGRGSAGGSGVPQEITLGSGLSMTGTTLSSTGGGGGPYIMASDHGIASGNSAATNTTALQALIDANTAAGATIYFTDPVPMNGGIMLKTNVKLAGDNFTAFKGSTRVGGGSGTSGSTPSGAAFLITDATNAFITIESNTSIDGIIFFYPSQPIATSTPGSSLIVYPPTIKKGSGLVQSISFTRLCFVANTQCFDFYSVSGGIADIVMDLIYSYPLGGVFVKMKDCSDIPRITRCHINPGAGYTFLGWTISTDVIDYVAANGAPTFELETCDEFMMSECFAFGVNTAFYLNDSYGTLVNCNADMVETGCHVTITSDQKYVALVSFNCIPGGGTLADRNAVVFDGSGGKLFATDLNAFTGTNSAVPSSSTPGANSLVLVSGSGTQRVSLSGARTASTAGSFAKFIDQTNGSAIVSYFDSDQQAVTTPSNSGQVAGLVQDNIVLSDATITSIAAETPTKLVRFTANGQTYKFFAVEDTTIYFYDTFTGTNGTNLTAHTPNVGSAWTYNPAAIDIQSNKAVNPALSGGDVATVDMSHADGTITVVFNAVTSNNDAIVFRATDSSNYWRFQVNDIGGGGTTAYLINTTAGSDTIVDSGATTLSSGADHTFEVILSGTSIICKLDGATIFTQTSSVRQTATIHGMMLWAGGDTADDFLFVS